MWFNSKGNKPQTKLTHPWKKFALTPQHAKCKGQMENGGVPSIGGKTLASCAQGQTQRRLQLQGDGTAASGEGFRWEKKQTHPIWGRGGAPTSKKFSACKQSKARMTHSKSRAVLPVRSASGNFQTLNFFFRGLAPLGLGKRHNILLWEARRKRLSFFHFGTSKT